MNDNNTQSNNLLFNFTIILFGIVTVTLFQSAYNAIRIAFKPAVSGNTIITALVQIHNILGGFPWFINPSKVGVSSVSLVFVTMITLIAHYVSINRNRDNYNNKYAPIFGIMDWCIAFFFFCTGRSLENLHEKLLIDTDTTWLLLIIVFSLILFRTLFNIKGTDKYNMNKTFIFIHFLILALLVFINGLFYDVMPLSYKTLYYISISTLCLYALYNLSLVIFSLRNSYDDLLTCNIITMIFGIILSILSLILIIINKSIIIDFYRLGKFTGPWAGIALYLSLIYSVFTVFIIPKCLD